MKFKEKYPNAQRLEMVENDILTGDKEYGCLQCGDLTKFIEICCEGYFCSRECIDAWYKAYDEHCQAMEREEEDNGDEEMPELRKEMVLGG